ncbi:MAG: triphosphoribosyl-dephospho-CoA synthase [Spirochaetia bacterium]|nr:triphosphoribosyl-dephospho-CoA synthase [Spirochaetia bacterium]
MPVLPKTLTTPSPSCVEAEALSKKAAEALKTEAWIAPKPGLVDRFGSGSHGDMDLSTFYRSAEAVSPYFGRMFECGFAASRRKVAAPREAFEQARLIGVRAEAAMYAATCGVNTHKGAIFTFGLLSTALGYLCGKERTDTFSAYQLLQCAAEMVQGIVERELSAGSCPPGAGAAETAGIKETSGERLYKSCGMTGIRGEAEQGYPSLLLYGLPVLESVRRGTGSLDQAGVQALLYLMTVVEDTNVAARGGMPGLLYVQESARRALSLGGAYSSAGRTFIQQLNSECVFRNISPGGSADLLSASLFIDTLFTI